MYSPVSKLFLLLARLLLTAYQWGLSPLVHLIAGPGQGCRFEPPCSEYAKKAIEAHGALRGSLFAAWRISRCNPFGGSGYDPVPVISPELSNQPEVKR